MRASEQRCLSHSQSAATHRFGLPMLDCPLPSITLGLLLLCGATATPYVRVLLRRFRLLRTFCACLCVCVCTCVWSKLASREAMLCMRAYTFWVRMRACGEV